MLKLNLLILFVILLPAGFAGAEVYKFVDKDGKTHYSTTAPHIGAPAAKLPPITKQDVSKTTTPYFSCHRHGGINCLAGADQDGSVICVDGYRDAIARFRFHCLAAQLNITEDAKKNRDGSFTVTVRNKSSVKATHVSVIYSPKGNEKITLEGNGTIEAFGIEEFTLVTKEQGFEKEKNTIKKNRFTVSCQNCQK